MSIDYCAAQSNYFAVKDEQKFRNWVAEWEELHLIDDGVSPFTFALVAVDPEGHANWPWEYDEELEGSDGTICPIFTNELSQHLKPGTGVILQEVSMCVRRHGRTQFGHAKGIAISSDGGVLEISLSDAIKKLSDDDMVYTCEDCGEPEPLSPYCRAVAPSHPLADLEATI